MYSTSLTDEELLAFIDGNLNAGLGKMFDSKVYKRPKSLKRLSRDCLRLNGTLAEIKAKKLTRIALDSCQLYDAMVYKFGLSNRHQKFWKSAMQIYRELKRLNSRNFVEPFANLTQKLEQCNFAYKPSSSTVCFLGSLLLERIVRLDRVRILCFRSADQSMGYVELKHLLTFNLMSIAIASDVAKEALRQIHEFTAIYNALADWFRKYSERFPPLVSETMLQSIRMESTKNTSKKRRRSSNSSLDIKNFESLLSYKFEEE